MSTNTFNDKETQNKGNFYPFLKILEDLIKETKEDILKKQNDENESET